MNTTKLIREELSKTDVDNQINKYVTTKQFRDAVEKIVKDRIKSEPELEDKVVEISKNVLTQLFKTLWSKRGVWRNNLTNKSS